MTPDLFDLGGTVALITGASSGIGLSIAHAFAQQGASLIMVSNQAVACENETAKLRAQGCDAAALACDVSRRGELQRMVEAARALHGRIDVLVCNAGVQHPPGPIGQATDEDWDTVMTVNLRSTLWLTSMVIPHMAEQGRGSVILMSSIAGLRGNKLLGIYSLSKAGVAALARNLAVEWGPRGVRINALSPGVIRTPFAKDMLSNPVVMERRLALTPLRRVGEPHEVAGVAVLLASAAGGFITGQNIVIDGGTTIGDGN